MSDVNQFEGQASNDPREYEWAEFNLPAELRDAEGHSAQQAAPSTEADR